MKIKHLIEIGLLAVVYLLLVSFKIYHGVMFSHTLPLVHVHTVTSGVIVGLLFFGNVFYLYPKYFSVSKKAYTVRALLMLIGCYFLESIIHAYKASALIKDQRGLEFNPFNMIFQQFNLEESILLVATTFLISMIYLYFRELVVKKNKLAPIE